MATNTAQIIPAVRRQPQQVVNTLKKTVNWNDPGIASGVAFDNGIPLGAFILQVMVQIVVAFNGGSTNVLLVGANATTYNDIVAAGDVDETTLGVTPVTRALGGALFVSAAKDIFAIYTQTGTPATAGQAVIVVTYEGGWAS